LLHHYGSAQQLQRLARAKSIRRSLFDQILMAIAPDPKVWLCFVLRVVVGEAINFPGAPDFLRSHGVEVVILDQPTLVKMMGDFIRAKPELWNEDIAE
jgi:hypothetical protein